MDTKALLLALGCLLAAALAFADTGIIPNDNVRMGHNTAGNKTFCFNIGNGASNPCIRWNNSSGAFEGAPDGVTYVPLAADGGLGANGNNSVSGSYNLQTTDKWKNLMVATSSASATVTLLASPSDGFLFTIKDKDCNAEANNITVARNGKNIDGDAQNWTGSANCLSKTFVYSSSASSWYTSK